MFGLAAITSNAFFSMPGVTAFTSTFSPFFGERDVGVADDDDDDDDYDANDTVSSGLLGDSSTSSSAIREAGTKDGKNKTKKRGKKSKKQKKTKKSSGKEAPAMNTVMADVV